MNNLNPYNPINFKEEFSKTHLHETIRNDFELVLYGDDWDEVVNGRTPRQIAATGAISVKCFYYLKFLTEKNPKNIYDLGCGWNFFKRYIPNIIGIGAEDNSRECFYGDLYDKFDDTFVGKYQNYFESIFSINALHFSPLWNLKKIILDFVSIIKPGGQGFLSLNLARMKELSQNKFDHFSVSDFDQYVRDQLVEIPVKYLCIDIDFEKHHNNWHSGMNEAMDGNIKLVFEKN